jgi:hypothetical protein
MGTWGRECAAYSEWGKISKEGLQFPRADLGQKKRAKQELLDLGWEEWVAGGRASVGGNLRWTKI